MKTTLSSFVLSSLDENGAIWALFVPFPVRARYLFHLAKRFLLGPQRRERDDDPDPHGLRKRKVGMRGQPKTTTRRRGVVKIGERNRFCGGWRQRYVYRIRTPFHSRLLQSVELMQFYPLRTFFVYLHR